ncbi:transposable element Tcb2 transposase [Trichonephila clavipes]|nr:transposable element Tcb2 transposase [Trichonephila clavipes]
MPSVQSAQVYISEEKLELVIRAVTGYESRFNLWNHDGRIRVRRYASERCLPDRVIERQRCLTPGVMAWGIPGAIFQQDNVRPHVAKTVRGFCSAQHMQLLPWLTYSPDMSPIEHVCVLIGRHLARDPCPAASKDELLLRIQDQARRRFVEWAQNEIAVVPDFHKRILFSDEAHFWLNGYVNKQNCRIWSESNPQVYVETPLHPEKLTVWCALWAGGILLQKR